MVSFENTNPYLTVASTFAEGREVFIDTTGPLLYFVEIFVRNRAV